MDVRDALRYLHARAGNFNFTQSATDNYTVSGCVDVILAELERLEKIDDCLNFKKYGAVGVGFRNNGQDIFAMPYDEYDRLAKKEEAFNLLADALKNEIEMYEVSPGETRLEINSIGYDMTNEEAKLLREAIEND